MSKYDNYDNKAEEELAKRFKKFMEGDYNDAPAGLEQSLEGIEDPKLRLKIIEAYTGTMSPN